MDLTDITCMDETLLVDDSFSLSLVLKVTFKCALSSEANLALRQKFTFFVLISGQVI